MNTGAEASVSIFYSLKFEDYYHRAVAKGFLEPVVSRNGRFMHAASEKGFTRKHLTVLRRILGFEAESVPAEEVLTTANKILELAVRKQIIWEDLERRAAQKRAGGDS